MDGPREHVAVEGHPVEAAGSRESVGPGVGREALEETDLVEVEVDAAVGVGGGGSDEGEGLGGALFGGVVERVLGELEALLTELANRLLARGASVDGTAAGELEARTSGRMSPWASCARMASSCSKGWDSSAGMRTYLTRRVIPSTCSRGWAAWRAAAASAAALRSAGDSISTPRARSRASFSSIVCSSSSADIALVVVVARRRL